MPNVGVERDYREQRSPGYRWRPWRKRYGSILDRHIVLTMFHCFPAIICYLFSYFRQKATGKMLPQTPFPGISTVLSNLMPLVCDRIHILYSRLCACCRGEEF